MKHIKQYEDKKIDDQVELLDDLLMENPLSKDHDFYLFIAKDIFIETKDGLYKKSTDIENMVRITPDAKSVSAMKGLEMRAMFQHDSHLYHIWLPQELRNDVEGKGTGVIEQWIVDLISKYKQKGGDSQGRQVLKDVIDRRKDIKNFNL